MPVLERCPDPIGEETEARRNPVSRLALKFTLDDDVSRMAVLAQEPPWRAIRAFQNSQRQALVHLHNVSGGLLAGDALELSIHARPATRVQVTSVGATRIYRTPPKKSAARLSTHIRVDDGAMLEYLPDVIIPFSGSRFSQSTTVALGGNAGFIGWETVAAGRIASGEEFAFDSLCSAFRIDCETRPLALERYSLTPASGNPRSVARWGRFRYTTTLYVCHTGVAQPRWSDLESQMNQLALLQTTHATRWGVSTLIAGGVVVRGLAMEAHQVTAGLETFWRHAKQEIWGKPAIMPRKIN
jgi:urease accessory protein